MKLARIDIYRFSLPLSRNLELAGESYGERHGLLLEIHADSGHVGLGEIAPLPAFSAENIEIALKDACALRYRFLGSEAPQNLEELSGGFDRWLNDLSVCPSARFGFESAVLNCLAARRGVGLRSLLSDEPADKISINALLTGSAPEVLDRAARLKALGYRTFKLKVGKRSIGEEVDLTRRLRETLGSEVSIRLDANRVWETEDYLTFARSVVDCDIEYIEEPTPSRAETHRLLTRDESPLPIALDESLREIEPMALREYPYLAAVILKPTLLGLEKSMAYTRVALGMGATPVISSSFESGVGLITLANLAAVIQRPRSAAGLDTMAWFGADLLGKDTWPSAAEITVSDLADPYHSLGRHMLEVVGCE